MIVRRQLGDVEDWLKTAESAVRGAGRVRSAYRDARAQPVPVVAATTPPAIFLERTLMLYLAVGAVALFAWSRLVK